MHMMIDVPLLTDRHTNIIMNKHSALLALFYLFASSDSGDKCYLSADTPDRGSKDFMM